VSTIHRVRGDDWAIALRVKLNGEPVDLSGATVTAQLRRRPGATVAATATVVLAAEQDGDGAGGVALTFPKAVTEGLSGTFVCDVQVDAGGIRQTWGNTKSGPLRVVVLDDVTREES
jgi:hypothetical protein